MPVMQTSLFDQAGADSKVYDGAEALNNVRKLYKMWKAGLLGGEFMPEDSNPHLQRNSEENLLYLTLPMALNYQRNSYKLWEGALASFNDAATRFIFSPNDVLCCNTEELRAALTKYKVAIQPNKHTEIWIRLCTTIVNELGGELSNLFERCDYTVTKILQEIQLKHKKNYPYLSGNKIANYWLYVLTQYADLPLRDRENISVAPDTHVIQSSYKLGLIHDMNATNVQREVAEAWRETLRGSEFAPIDIHTPMWLWSRGGFADLVEL